MKKILTSACILLSLVTGNLALSAESNSKSASTSAATATSFTGEFSGDWVGADGTGGTLTLTIKRGQNSDWALEAIFTYEGANIPTETQTVQIAGSKLTTVFAWKVQGVAATSKLTGELKGDQLEGGYESTSTEGAAQGKWKVVRKPARS